MEDNTLIRTPQVATEIVQELHDKDEPTIMREGTDPTPEELVKLGRHPYATELLEAEMAYDTFDVKDQLREIDAYIREDGGTTKESYKKVLDGLYKSIKTTDSVYTNIEQLRDYVRIQQKIKDVIREKKEFEQMDPEDMSSAQLKRYFNAK